VVIVWAKKEPLGVEFADVAIGHNRLTAIGTALGSEPLGYRLDYKLETGPRFVTRRLMVESRGDGWRRRLDLRRLASGRWTARTSSQGRVDLAPPGGNLSAVHGALDCDLALSPLTNTMPVLRDGILRRGGPLEYLMAWVSVPDLHVYPSRQRYRFVRKDKRRSVVRYESESRDFVANLTFSRDGLCLRYPGIGYSV
jgi:hypothetical protein